MKSTKRKMLNKCSFEQLTACYLDMNLISHSALSALPGRPISLN